jgi:hypothetical protein
MATAQSAPAIGLITIPRAVLSVAAGVVHGVECAVVGDDRVRTARGNAYDAMCADRARAQARHETSRLVAALAATTAPTATGADRAVAAELAALNARPAPNAQPSISTALTAPQPAVGSSPRSSASQAVRVSVPA